jgi:hypothetical protein
MSSERRDPTPTTADRTCRLVAVVPIVDPSWKGAPDPVSAGTRADSLDSVPNHAAVILASPAASRSSTPVRGIGRAK